MRFFQVTNRSSRAANPGFGCPVQKHRRVLPKDKYSVPRIKRGLPPASLEFLPEGPGTGFLQKKRVPGGLLSAPLEKPVPPQSFLLLSSRGFLGLNLCPPIRAFRSSVAQAQEAGISRQPGSVPGTGVRRVSLALPQTRTELPLPAPAPCPR